MRLKQRLACMCAIFMILLLIVQECDAIKSSGSRKSSSSSGRRGSNTVTHKKPEPSAPRIEQKKPIGWNTGSNTAGSGSVGGTQSKPIGWNVPGSNNPGAPPPYSNTHTRGLSNPGGVAPPYSKTNPAGHQTIQSNVATNQNAGLNYPRNTGTVGGSYPNQGAHYPGVNQGAHYPGVNQGGQYPGVNQGGHYPGVNQGGQYPGVNQGGHYPGINPNQGGQYSGMNYGAGGYGSHSGYGSHHPSPAYSPAAPNGYFASGYPTVNNYYAGGGGQQRSGSSNTLTNTLLAGSLGLGLYNAIRPYPSYSSGLGGGSYGGAGLAGGNTVHHHYYNNQATGANPNQSPDTVVQTNQNTNAAQPAVAPIPQSPTGQNTAVDATAAIVTPPPPTLAPDNQITDLDCVYAMKILNCTAIPLCPQEWLHPSCLNRTISKEYFDSIALPPPPPMPEIQPEQNGTVLGKTSVSSDQLSPGQDKNVYPLSGQQQLPVVSSNGQQLPVVYSSTDQQLPSASSSTTTLDYSLCLTILLAVPTLMNKFELFV